MQELYLPDGGAITYLPSILIIGNPSSRLQLKQRLENFNCRVCHINISLDNLDIVRRQYFDAVVFNLEQAGEDRLETYQMIMADPELAGTLVIVLAPDTRTANTINGLNSGNVYCLRSRGTGDTRIASQIRHIIDYIQYMTCRYA